MSYAAIAEFKSYIHATPDSIQHAAGVYEKLAFNGYWMPASEFHNNEDGVLLLDRLELVWRETIEGVSQVRLMPASFARKIQGSVTGVTGTGLIKGEL